MNHSNKSIIMTMEKKILKDQRLITNKYTFYISNNIKYSMA